MVLNVKIPKYLPIEVNYFPFFFYQYISWYETVIADNDYCPFNA